MKTNTNKDQQLVRINGGVNQLLDIGKPPGDEELQRELKALPQNDEEEEEEENEDDEEGSSEWEEEYADEDGRHSVGNNLNNGLPNKVGAHMANKKSFMSTAPISAFF